MLSLSTDAEGIVRFSTLAAPVVSLGAHRVKPPSAPYASGAPSSHNSFVLEGLADMLVLGAFTSNMAGTAESWTSLHTSSNCFYSEGPLDRAWALVNKAFDDDLLLAVKGWVRNDAAPPSEAAVRAALARAAAGESVVIPAAATSRTLFVTDVTVTKRLAGTAHGRRAGGNNVNAISSSS